MRRLALLVGVVLVAVLCLVNFAFAAPAMSGLWAGTAQKVTTASCSTVPVSMNLVQCFSTGNPLVRGTVTVAGKPPIPVVGRIGDYGFPNNFQLSGFQITSTTARYVYLYGTYVASPSPRIMVNNLMVETSGTEATNEQYNVFPLIKK